MQLFGRIAYMMSRIQRLPRVEQPYLADSILIIPSPNLRQMVTEMSTACVATNPRSEEPWLDQSDIPFTYNIDVTTLYKGDLNVAQELEVTTAGNDGACAAYLVVGEEYLLSIDLVGGVPWVYLCGLHKIWSSVSDEDKAALESGCNDDPCNFACDQHQVLVLIKGQKLFTTVIMRVNVGMLTRVRVALWRS